jgi:cobalamin-dependent methionine synthase I
MFVIANNITTRKSSVRNIFRQARNNGWGRSQHAVTGLQQLAEECAAAGADALEINIQQHYDFPEAMDFAVNAVQETTDCQLCLSTNSPQALEAGLKACRKPPIFNYISVDQTALKDMLPMIGEYGAETVLLVSGPASTADVREMLKKAAILIGAANESGIPNERLLLDPGLIHIGHEIGQRHLVEVMEFFKALPDATEPVVRSTCWLSNISSGIPLRLRSGVEASLLSELAGLGLSSVFLDVLRSELMRTVRLIKVFNNQAVYSDAYVEAG